MRPNRHRPLIEDLTELPVESPPTDVWPRIQARLKASPKRPRQPWLAAAAVLLIASTTMLSWQDQQPPLDSLPLDQWTAYNRQLESQLQTLNRRTSIYRGHHAVAIDTLEDMLQRVDHALAQNPTTAQQLALWQRRATLLHDLVSVHTEGGWMSSELRPVLTLNPPTSLVAYSL